MTAYAIGDIPLILRRHPRARRLKLRFEAQKGAALLTLPPGVSDHKAVQFAEKHRGWISEQLAKSPPVIRFAPGALVPFCGEIHQILHQPQRRAQVTADNRQLIVGGPAAGFETRLRNWLGKQARAALTAAVEGFVPQVGQRPRRIMVRDTSSRWGSCSSKKTLSFSWRLIMAPPAVLSYVAAHEMAHLIEMNHSPAFWRLVEKLDPDWKRSRRWLKTEGGGLMVIG